MDRLLHLELFIHIAERGSLAKAADAVGISTPAASRHLAALENRLQVRLVERNTRRLYLTGEGQDFYERARVILADLKEAESSINSMTLNPSGLLRVSASLSFSMQLIAPRLHKYHQRYPHVRVHLEAANRYMDMIDNGIDVAIRTREYEPDSSITIRKLASTRRILTASPKYLSTRGIPKHPTDLLAHDLLIYIHANKPHELHLTKSGDSVAINVHGLIESNDGQVLRAAAREGLGILVQPSYIVYDDIVAGRLVPLLDDWDLPRLQINIAYQSRRHLSAKVRSFIDYMVNEFETNEFERKWNTRF
jgi:DNA-binding transcriptional LysR family regulator